MDRLSAIIVDDNVLNRDTLGKMLDQFLPDIHLVGKADSVKNACELIHNTSPQIVFLDIEMPEETGFELFKYFPQPNFAVIFTTADANYALKAIKFAALDYLLKPINLNELKSAINKATIALNKNSLYEKSITTQIRLLKNTTENNQYAFKKIAIPTQEGMDFFEVEDIIRCEADRAYCNFYLTGKRKITAAKPLREFEDILEESSFFRIHKSDMVNLKHIKKYFKGKGGYVIMSDDSQVEVSIRKKDELLQILQQGKKSEVID